MAGIDLGAVLETDNPFIRAIHDAVAIRAEELRTREMRIMARHIANDLAKALSG